MNELEEAIGFIRSVKASEPTADKERIQAAFAARFNPQRKRSLFIGLGYSMRFSETKGYSFSNTVLSLSALREVDDRPVVVCAVGPTSIRFLLANSTFLKKVSHSSHRLRVDNVKGASTAPTSSRCTRVWRTNPRISSGCSRFTPRSPGRRTSSASWRRRTRSSPGT